MASNKTQHKDKQYKNKVKHGKQKTEENESYQKKNKK